MFATDTSERYVRY